MKLEYSKQYIIFRFLKDDQIETLEPVSVIIDGSLIIEVPKGFITDGASIPVFFHRLIGHPFKSKFIVPALIHDFCYTSHCVSKDYADTVFYKGLLSYNVPKWRAWMMWKSVKWFGKSAWKN